MPVRNLQSKIITCKRCEVRGRSDRSSIFMRSELFNFFRNCYFDYFCHILSGWMWAGLENCLGYGIRQGRTPPWVLIKKHVLCFFIPCNNNSMDLKI